MITEEEREKRKQRKERRIRKAEREFKKSLTEPPVDKMVRFPEVKKGIWDNLIARGRDINSRDGIIR